MSDDVGAPSDEQEQPVAKMRDMTFAMLLRAWLLRHRAARVVGEARGRVKEPPRAAIGQK